MERGCLQNDRTLAGGQVLDCLMQTAKAEGLLGFYKGWMPLYLRLGATRRSRGFTIYGVGFAGLGLS